MSESSIKKAIPAQKLTGMQVIDTKGALVGAVKDVGIDLNEQKLILIVTTRAKTDIEITWSDIQSIEDVVLLGKEIEIPEIPASTSQVPPSPPAAVVTVCPTCKTTVPAHAKFCPKCGKPIR